MDIQKVWETTKAFGKAFLHGLDHGLEKVCEIERESAKYRTRYYPPNGHQFGSSEIVELTPEMAANIRWMNASKLQAIFAGKTVRVGNDPRVWDELRWMNASQLDAVFHGSTWEF